MNNPLISIIIPVYNSEKYLKECLDSIINQTYNNLEIIIIDDESSDNTIDIINKYNDSRIKIYRKNNEGVSEARNLGLSKVTGDYILFIDSDDYLSNNDVISNLVGNINNNDLIRFNNSKLINNELINEDISLFKDEYKSGEDFLLDALNNNKKYSWYLWQYLYKKELWDGIRFPKGKIFEDTSTIYQVILKANNIKVIKDNYYVYRYNSVSLSKKVNLKICLDMIDVISDTSNIINKLNINDKLKKLLLNNLSYGYITDINVLKTLSIAEQEILKDKLLKNKYLIDYCLYDKEVMIKYLVKVFGINITSKLLNVRRELWKK